MRFSIFLFIPLLILLSCRKEDKITTDPRVQLEFSTDTVLFDTVFTSLGSVTQRVKVFNRSENSINIAEIKLAGNVVNAFHINVNGVPATELRDIKIKGNDSINVFVKATIDPNTADIPFLVNDSISFLTNGNQQYLHLKAYGQNANFVRNGIISTDTNWDSKLPYIIYNTLKIQEGTTLTIKKGSRIYFHKGARMEVAGTLNVDGTFQDSVTFSSDRMERIYLEESGQWDGIRILKTSKDNIINHAAIKNAIIGIQVDSLAENLNPKLIIANSVIRNMEIAGIIGNNASISGFNNIISNCEKHLIYCTKGGIYNFKQNTFANPKSRSTPSIYLNDNSTNTTTEPLKLILINNIIWGTIADELVVEVKNNQSSELLVRSNLVKSRDKSLEIMGNILNQDPLFQNVRNNNFKVISGSSAENKGENLSGDPDFSSWISKDYTGKDRTFPSDLGSYEIF